MERRVLEHLEQLLDWCAGDAGEATRRPGGKPEARAYAGGVLSTLLKFGLISEAEEREWGPRILRALGDDPDDAIPVTSGPLPPSPL